MGYLENRQREVQQDQFEAKLDRIVGHFIDIKKSIDHALLISHTDADGYAASAILKYMLEREGIKYSTRYYNRKAPWSQYLDSLIPQFDHVENLAVFFSDIGSEVNELGKYFQKEKAYVWIMDHHEMNPVHDNKLPADFHYVNPTSYGFDGLKEIAGATLVYLFAKQVSFKNINTAWMGLIGITNDTLMNIADYKSYNLRVLEDAIEEEQINLHNGLMVYGATHETIKNALAYSVFPFIKEIGGKPKKAQEILDKLQISPSKHVINLEQDEINQINNRFPEELIGQYIEFPKKKGILRFAFEHGLLISQSAFKTPHQAEKLIESTSTPAKSTEIYRNYIRNLTKNLGLFVSTPKEITANTILVDAGRRLSPNYWSDVASYASVNNMYDPKKILILGGQNANLIKLSIRCTGEYPALYEGKGVDFLIDLLKKSYGGSGGGHKLAGGYKIAPNRFKKLKNEIDNFFPL
jgi:single-stranded DNA-specific DHH superfamily exonuclease